jgi:hypothetical protein
MSVTSSRAPRALLRRFLAPFLADVLGQLFSTGAPIPSFVHFRIDLALHQQLGKLAPLRLRLDSTPAPSGLWHFPIGQ